MRKSRFTEAQINHILGQADGTASPSEIQRLNALEQENKKLKALVADLSLDKRRVPWKPTRPSARRPVSF